jgi:hypothetical protein
LRAQGDIFLEAKATQQGGTVMTIKLQLVDLGDAMVETRQLPVVPLFFDNLTAFGLLPF